MTTTQSIPNEVKEFINKYLKLDICGEVIACPYYLNSGGFLKEPILSGKGNPFDIESRANRMLANHQFVEDRHHLIRAEMERIGLGIDCSGLVYQALNKWLRDVLQKGELKDYLPAEKVLRVRRYFSRLLKPEASVSADMFTSEPISHKIDVRDVKPGDLLRTRGGKHLLLITDVEYKVSIPKKLIFVNSTTYYERNGIRYGEILLNDDLNLATAEWRDLIELNGDDDTSNFAYKGYRELINNNGLWRPDLPLFS